MPGKWKGIMISESLLEPSLIGYFEVYKARISKKDLDLGEGRRGRWHFYHVRATDSQVSSIQAQVKPGWYVHFWSRDELIVVFSGKKFGMKVNDKSTWSKAIEYGRSIGIPPEELDFPTK